MTAEAPAAEPPRAWATRIAPTPSGFLHEGNAVNMLLSAWWASSAGGRLLLRIDDFDTVRIRPEYLADIFDTLLWLDIETDEGPTDPGQFARDWSMGMLRQRFAAARDRLLDDHPEDVFVCLCSRSALDAQGFCAAACRRLGLPWVADDRVVRLHVPPGITVWPRTATGGPPPSWPVPPGDHVLWRRDDLPAYQLGSVVADETLGVSAVLRGADLIDSSALQLYLAALLPAPSFAEADLRHHALLTDRAGHKLSKSAGARATPLPRTAQLRAHLLRSARALGAPIGITPPG